MCICALYRNTIASFVPYVKKSNYQCAVYNTTVVSFAKNFMTSGSALNHTLILAMPQCTSTLTAHCD